MSLDQPDFAPIALHKDRYGGCYSGGRWLAVANADVLIEGRTRSEWVAVEGPGDGDIPCAMFWKNPPRWIALGNTPEQALSAIISRNDLADEEWSAESYREVLRSCFMDGA